jgi:hypothetical protein
LNTPPFRRRQKSLQHLHAHKSLLTAGKQTRQKLI